MIIKIDDLQNILVGCGKNILKIKKFLYSGKENNNFFKSLSKSVCWFKFLKWKKLAYLILAQTLIRQKRQSYFLKKNL